MNQLLSSNQTLTTETSRTVCRVAQFLGGGGQGEVYKADLNGAPVALKWYFRRSATMEQRLLLEDLIARGSPDHRFLWPMELVSDPHVAGFGYVMGLRDPRHKGIVDLMKRRAEPSFRALATAGYQLADSYYQLHSSGLCYRDISFGNVFFDPKNGDVLICDNDNVAVNRQATGGVLGTPKFMAPEIVRGEASPSRDTDLYSLAVLLFYMLMVHHPLEGKRESSIKCFDLPAMNKIYGAEPLFIFDPNDDTNRPDPKYHRNALEYWPIYPQSLRNLFVRSFTEGLRDPQHGRVKETEWRAAMIHLRDLILPCANCGEENFFDPDVNYQLGNCWSCKNPLRSPFRLHIGTKTVVVLNHDTKLFAHHLDGQKSYDFSRIAAEVSLHPADPNVWGLKNLTGQKWVVTLPEGTISDVVPGRNVRLAAGTKINFGTIEGEVYL
ncbi:MAG: protein kinase [Planctomycetes bacterium]|nr:protein kinase [Planctomycetota bacterium]